MLIRTFAPLLAVSWLLAGPAAAITLGQVDDFSTDAQGWSPAIGSGGVLGINIEAGQPVQIMNSDQWTGDYLNAGVEQVAMLMVNNSIGEVWIRVAIGSGFDVANPDTTGTWYVSSVPKNVLSGGGLDPTELLFDLDEAALSLVVGSDPLADVLADVDQLRILHSLSAVQNTGQTRLSTTSLGIHEIAAVPEPSVLALLGVGAGLLAVGRSGFRIRRRGTPTHAAISMVARPTATVATWRAAP